MTATIAADPGTREIAARVRAIIATRPPTACPVTITRNDWGGHDYTRSDRRVRLSLDDTDIALHLFHGPAIVDAAARLTHLNASVVAHIITEHLDGAACYEPGHQP